jgi:hypothetical protein
MTIPAPTECAAPVDVGSGLYRERNLRAFEILRSRNGRPRRYPYRADFCYGCSLAATNPEAGCLTHGIAPQAY